MKKAFLQNFIYLILSIVFLWIVWIILYYSIGNDYLFPNFISVFSSIGELLKEQSFYVALGYTFLRAFLSFLFSFLLAIIFMIISQIWSPFRKFFAPIVSIIRTVPTMAILLIILLWTTPSSAPIYICCLVLFPMLYSMFCSGIDNIDKNLIELSNLYHIPLYRQIEKLYLPNITAYVFPQLATSFSFSLKLIVSAEILSSTYQSLGGMMQTAQIYLQIPRLMALTICIIIIGLIIEGLFSLLNKKIYRWRYL